MAEDASAGVGANVGVAWVALRFSARGAAAQIRSQLAGETAGLGATMGTGIGKSMQKSFSSQLKKLGSSLTAEGKKLSTHLTLPIVAAGAASVHMAATFQASMTKVRTQAGASQKEVDKMSAAILKMGQHSQQGPEKLSEGLYHLESLGLRGAKALDALRASENLANVSGADMEETTSAIGAAWRSGIKGASSFGKTAATLNAIVGAGNMRMADLVAALGTGILPSARSFGVSIKSVGAAMAVMTDEGVPAVDAATRLRMSLSLMGAPSAQAEKVLNGIGLTGTKLATAMRGPKGLLGAVELLHDHMQGLSKVAQAQLISKAFGGGRSSGAITTLLNQIDVMKLKIHQVDNGMGKFGEDTAKQATTASAKFALFRSAVETLGIKLGNALLPFFSSLAQKLSGIVDGFSHMSKGTQKFILIAAGIAAAVGPILLFLGGVARGVSAIIDLGKATKIFTAQMWVLNAAMDANPVGIVILALEALVVAFVIAYTRSKTFRKIVQTAMHDVVVAGKAVGRFFSHDLEAAWNGVAKFAEVWALRMALTFARWAKFVIHAANDAFGWVPFIGPKLKKADDAIGGFISSVQKKLYGLTHPQYTIKFGLGLPAGVKLSASAQGQYVRAQHYAKGTGGALPGYAWVGEEGPELVKFRGGETVLTNPVSQAVTRGYAGGTGGLTVHLSTPSIQKMAGVLGSTVAAIVRAVRASAEAKLAASGGYGGMGVAPTGPLQTYARKLLAAYGWGGQWTPFNDIVMSESGWNVHATNPTSGAYGIPQALPASKMAAAGADWMTNGFTQLKWMMGYIRDRYGSPAAAWAFHLANNAYDRGGIARGLGFLPKRTPKPERVLSPQQTKAFDRLVDMLDGKGGASGKPSRYRVEFDPRRMEMWIRELSAQEARGEIAFNKGR